MTWVYGTCGDISVSNVLPLEKKEKAMGEKSLSFLFGVLWETVWPVTAAASQLWSDRGIE